VAKQFSAPVDSFQAVLAQTSFKERLISAAGMFGKQAALLNSKSYEGP
jgi:hypothetical protein